MQAGSGPLPPQGTRNAGIDLYKILCMFLVVSFHFSDHGSVQIAAGDELTLNWGVLAVSRVFGGICNCAFVLSTGYFLCEKKAGFARVARLWLQVLFYSVLCGTAAFLMGFEPFSVTLLVKMFLPLTFAEYWYFTDYVILVLASPLINLLLDKMDRNQHLFLVAFCFLIIVWFPAFGILYVPGKFNFCFFFLYIVAAYLRKYRPGDRLGAAVYGWLGGAFFFLEVLSIFAVRVYDRITGDDRPFWSFVWGMDRFPCVMTSVFLFIFFSRLRLRGSRLAGSVASSLFAVYLLQIGRLWKLWFRVLFNNERTYGTNLMIPQILLCSAVIFMSAILIDKIRIHAFERPLLALLKKCAGRRLRPTGPLPPQAPRAQDGQKIH